MLTVSIPSSSFYCVQRYCGTADGWQPETGRLSKAVAERRLKLRQAVRGDLWAYRIAPFSQVFSVAGT